MSEIQTNPEQERATRVAQLKQELKEYGLRGLEGRAQHGLDAGAMMAIKETRDKVLKIAETLGMSDEDIQDAEELIKNLHVGAIWREAKRLIDPQDKEAGLWHIMSGLCIERNNEADYLDDKGFLEDVERVKSGLEDIGGSAESIQTAIEQDIKARTEGNIDLEDGVPIDDKEYPFMKMATAGYEFGVWKNGDIFLVASDTLDYSKLEEIGLKKVRHADMSEPEERRGEYNFYQDENGNDVVKERYPGFAIVFGDNQDVAIALAKTGHIAQKSE